MTDTPTWPTERTALLTGAASERGIGRAAAELLAEQGWAVAILDVDAKEAQAAADDIAARHGVPTLGVGTDVSDGESVAAAVGRMRLARPKSRIFTSSNGVIMMFCGFRSRWMTPCS